MLEYLKKKYFEIVASLIDPIVARALALSWVMRLAIVLIPLGLWGGWEYREQLKNHLALASRCVAILQSRDGVIPLPAAARNQAIDIAARLRAMSAADANLIAAGQLTGWSAAQALSAISSEERYAQAQKLFAHFIREKRIPTCNCWAELNNEDETKSWLFISGWVLRSLAQIGESATVGEVESILRVQNADGSWGPSAIFESTEHSSTYTTSWLVIGLSSQLKADLLPPEVAALVKASLPRALTWLLQKRSPGARWKPYPNQANSSISGSVSALVLHTLHTAKADDLNDIYLQWLDNIPKIAIPASVGENNYVEIRKTQTVQIDHFVQLTMPWMLIATLDAFQYGSLLQRARALLWIEALLSHESMRNADTEQNNWWRAELSIALNYLTSKLQ